MAKRMSWAMSGERTARMSARARMTAAAPLPPTFPRPDFRPLRKNDELRDFYDEFCETINHLTKK